MKEYSELKKEIFELQSECETYNNNIKDWMDSEDAQQISDSIERIATCLVKMADKYKKLEEEKIKKFKKEFEGREE